MKTRLALASFGALLLLVLVPAGPALAGGGCHNGVTNGSGTTVEIVDACFTPTILHVQPGDSVRFVNTDPFVHNVTANLWGHFDDLEPGTGFSATFDDPGVYPYACTYHPGMSGAIVVGDGTGAGNGVVVTGPTGTAASGATVGASTGTAEQVAANPVVATTDASSTAWPWLGGIAIGLAAGIALATAIRRRPRTG
jgi:plastocyanin